MGAACGQVVVPIAAPAPVLGCWGSQHVGFGLSQLRVMGWPLEGTVSWLMESRLWHAPARVPWPWPLVLPRPPLGSAPRGRALSGALTGFFCGLF